MVQSLREGELLFDFHGAISFERMDIQNSPIPHGMALVDFVVEEKDRVLLVEVKDPSNSAIPHDKRDDYAKRMQTKTLIFEELVPKARDSYTYLHLMDRASKPFIYVVVLGLDQFNIGPEILSVFKDRLLARIRKEGREPWIVHYVKDCVVVDITRWSKHFPDYTLSRSP